MINYLLTGAGFQPSTVRVRVVLVLAESVLPFIHGIILINTNQFGNLMSKGTPRQNGFFQKVLSRQLLPIDPLVT